MERPDFIPPKDAEWLNRVVSGLEGFGEETSRPQNDFIDFESLSYEEQKNVSVANLYVDFCYRQYIGFVADLEAEAFRMMRTLASFIESAYFQDGDILFRISDKFPDVNVGHVQMAVRIKQQETVDMLGRASEGSDFYKQAKMYETHFGNLFKISEKAVEFEDRRKRRGQ